MLSMLPSYLTKFGELAKQQPGAYSTSRSRLREANVNMLHVTYFMNLKHLFHFFLRSKGSTKYKIFLTCLYEIFILKKKIKLTRCVQSIRCRSGMVRHCTAQSEVESGQKHCGIPSLLHLHPSVYLTGNQMNSAENESDSTMNHISTLPLFPFLVMQEC
jgi:hypothetical protein